MRHNKKEKLTFWQKLHKYRAKIGLITFAVVIPMALVAVTYLGPYFSNKNVYFDEDKVDVQRKFESIDDLDELSFTITWKELIEPRYDNNEPAEIIVPGSLRFNISYEAKGTYDISSVNVTPVLHPDWFPYNSIGPKKTVTTIPSNMSITWNEDLELHKLLFVTVTEPNLYLKVEYSYVIADQTINETAYLKYSLAGINPETVTVYS